jgi:DNA-binding NarL/FixJ family response regulator
MLQDTRTPPMPTDTVKVLCVDDNPDLGRLYRVVIDAQPGMQCVGCLDAADDLAVEVERSRPDVLLIDLTMPGKDPLLAIRELSKSHPETRAIVFSGLDDPATIDRAIEAGAWGYVSKSSEIQDVLAAIRRVSNGDVSLP